MLVFRLKIAVQFTRLFNLRNWNYYVRVTSLVATFTSHVVQFQCLVERKTTPLILTGKFWWRVAGGGGDFITLAILWKSAGSFYTITPRAINYNYIKMFIIKCTSKYCNKIWNKFYCDGIFYPCCFQFQLSEGTQLPTLPHPESITLLVIRTCFHLLKDFCFGLC